MAKAVVGALALEGLAAARARYSLLDLVVHVPALSP